MKKYIILLILTCTSIGVFAKDYKGAEIQSKKAFHFGKFETRFSSSTMSGMLSTFFLFENEGYLPCCKWQEIDVEVFGKGMSNSWQSNPIYQTSGSGDRLVAEEVHELPKGHFVDEFYTYTVEWTPDYIKWYVNDELIRSYTDTAALKVIGEKPMLAMFNHWTSEWLDWTGPFDGTECPSYQIIDYIKVYDWVEDSTFTEKPTFEDSFDGDLSQWNISTHTFDGNVCDFSAKNVEVRDGNVILAFTTKEDEGVAKNVSPNGKIKVKSSKWEETIVYDQSTTGLLMGNAIYDGAKVNVYNEKGEFLGRSIIVYGVIDFKKYDAGWYYFTISKKPKILRKIEKI